MNLNCVNIVILTISQMKKVRPKEVNDLNSHRESMANVIQTQAVLTLQGHVRNLYAVQPLTLFLKLKMHRPLP